VVRRALPQHRFSGTPFLLSQRYDRCSIGRARLSETAGSPVIHRSVRPNAFASRDGCRPNRMQHLLGSAVSERPALPARVL
jgi:hypothetical protein